MKSTKLNKGITLIVLVITIIILLILAGITIATLTGENGILSKAKKAKENTEEAQLDEEEKLSQMENIMLIMSNEIPVITIENKDNWAGKEGKKVTITTKEKCTTKYTIDGSEPGIDNGIVYTGEITVVNNCIIKDLYVSNDLVSAVASRKNNKDR